MSLMFAALKKLESPDAAPLALPARARSVFAIPALALALGATGIGGWWIGSRADAGGAPAMHAEHAQTLPTVDLTASNAAGLAQPATYDAEQGFAFASIALNDGTARDRIETVEHVFAPPIEAPTRDAGAPATPVTIVASTAAQPAPAADARIAVAPAPHVAPTGAQAAIARPDALPVATNAAAASFDATAAAVDVAMAASEPAAANASAGRDPDVIDAQGVARAVTALETAVQAGDREAAQAQLSALAALLPAQSLTLLRMRAWVAHQGGDTETALVLYRDIVARMPGDRTAAINLAMLEASSGDADGARLRLRQLRTAPGSREDIDRAIAQVEATLQAARR